MSDAVIWEMLTIIKSIWIGAVLGFAYDNIRIFRRVLRHKSILPIIIEDILYGIYAGVRCFIFIYNVNFGQIRAFILIGIILGVIIYNRSLSSLYVVNVTKLIKLLLKPLQMLLSKFNMALKNLGKERDCFESGKQKRKSTKNSEEKREAETLNHN